MYRIRRRRSPHLLGHNRPRSFKALISYMIADSKKDYYFRIRNREKADKTVLRFVYSAGIRKDRRFYSACRTTYRRYCELCAKNKTKPLSSWQFKKQMQLLGFVYQKHHRFYSGYYGNTVTTAFKNIGFMAKDSKIIEPLKKR